MARDAAKVPDVPARSLNDGTTMPALGFGTVPMRGRECVDAVAGALQEGYRLVDTAVNYGNETEVGEGIRASGVPRDEVLVTTKIPGRDHGYADALASVHGSLERLGLERLDLALIHWPNPSVGRYHEAWRALVELRQQGVVRSIGVSNFTEEHLRTVIEDTGVTPAVNQIELHPRFPQERMRRVNADLGVLTEAWSPLGKRAAPLDEAAVTGPATAYAVTPGQVILRWHQQIGSVPIPKSATARRRRENLDVFGFSLTESEVAAISALAREDGRLFGGDPDTHEEM